MEAILFLIPLSITGLIGIAAILWGYKLQEYNLSRSKKSVKFYSDMWLYGSVVNLNKKIYGSKYYLLLIKAMGIFFIAFSILGITLIILSIL